ncbi:MAG: hypothetical protein RR185_08145, partial [Angelakisella sp.]
MRQREKKRIPWKIFFNYFVFITLVASLIFVVVAMVRAPTLSSRSDPFQRVKGDYVLMLSQCVLGIFGMMLPGFLKKRVNIEIPSTMLVLYAIFLYCAIYLGEVRSFYYNVPHWDTMLHTFSGAMLGALGFSFINLLNRTDKVPVNLSPAFVATFAFCFALALGIAWEIYEFTADSMMGTNMQKFGTEAGELFLGQAALKDTMKDLIVDTIGALVISIIGYISLKYKKGWVEKL